MIKQLTLKPKSGLLTKLQSDTIYGHFCWRLKEQAGESRLKEFISSYQEGKPVFLISDGLIKEEDEIFFPKPFRFDQPVHLEKKEDSILEFVKRKNEKENRYYTIEQLNSFLNNRTVSNEVENETEIKTEKRAPVIEEQLRISVQIDRKSFAAEEKKLFSYNPVFLREDFYYVLLIKILDDILFEGFNCENILKDIFVIGYGKKKTSGYGQFDEDISFERFDKIEEPIDGNGFVVLGNYLPSAADHITPAGYDINIKYGKLGEHMAQSANPFKSPVTFFTAGSCFLTDVKKNYYGRVTDNGEISESFKESVQFGCPFYLRMKMQAN
jgi:CRISPR-associated protein Csm4